jgi:hypothetical protein
LDDFIKVLQKLNPIDLNALLRNNDNGVLDAFVKIAEAGSA